MTRLRLQNLCVESTRRCNMTCAHCLRGEAESLDMTKQIQEQFLSQVDYIDTVTFTGGEPSLYPQAIEDFISICKSKHIEVGNFYIATNGRCASSKFMLVMMELYLFCGDNEYSGLDISNDQYHDNDPNVVEKLQVFKFAGLKYDEQPRHFINQGFYADNFGDGREEAPSGFEIDDNHISDNTITLNCEGNIIAGCDWSFARQQEDDIIVCHVGSENYLEEFKRYNQTF